MKVIVVGAGIIGRSVAWRLAQRGAAVRLVDPDPSRSAAIVAAGMLAPVTEAHFGEEERLGFHLESARRWPRFAAELAAESGHDAGFLDCGTLAVARDSDDMAVLRRVGDYLEELGLEAEPLSAAALRRLEPALAPRVRGGLRVPGDHQVDPRRALAALRVAGERLGVQEQPVAAVQVEAHRVTLDGGTSLQADAVVVCAGWAIADLVDLPIRPVKGQLLRLAATESAVMPTHVLRGLEVYIVPRPGGEIVVGATSEEIGPDTTVTAGAVRRLLEEAWELVPGLDEARLVETSAGLRPASPDGEPILDTIAGVHVAAGHHRSGVLLAPATADAVAAAVCGDGWPEEVEPFRAERFVAAP